MRSCRKNPTKGVGLKRLILALGLWGLLGDLTGQPAASAADAPQTPVPSEPVKTSRKKPPEKLAEPSQAEAPKDDTVVVKGERSLNRIDRQVYDTTKDPDHETGTTADALNKVPGVNVDPSGDVTLRGNAVEILLNGKPSPLLSGDNRAAALRAMPSSIISSIEVMSNPGAQYGSQGAGGVINIVTRRAMPPGYFVSLTGTVMSNGGYSTNVLGQYNKEKLAASGFVNILENRNRIHNGLSFSQLGANGVPSRTTQSDGLTEDADRMDMVNANLDYALNEIDTLTAQLNYDRMANHARRTGRSETYDAAGVAIELYDSNAISGNVRENQSLGLGWTHVGKRLGEGLKVDVRLSRADSASEDNNRFNYSLSRVASNQGLREHLNRLASHQTTGDFSLDYSTSLGDDQLTTGLQITRAEVREDSLSFDPYTPGAGTPVINAALSNRFIYNQTLSAAYLTHQKAVGTHWAVLGGLRSETLAYDSHSDLTGAPVHVTYTRLNPSLFATYVISETKKLRLNYSRRLQRPSPRDLNPSRVYNNLQRICVGAPTLKPEETHSFEASYEYSHEITNYSARLYHLQNNKVINPVSTVIDDPLNPGNPIIQMTRRNAGHSNQTGAQLTYFGLWGAKWMLNAMANAYVTHIYVPDALQAQSQTTQSSQIGVSYTVSSRNHLSFTYNSQGKQLTGEGYISGYASSSLMYFRSLGQATNLTLSANDIFRTSKRTNTSLTPNVRSFGYNSSQAPTFYISLSQHFGGGSCAIQKEPYLYSGWATWRGRRSMYGQS